MKRTLIALAVAVLAALLLPTVAAAAVRYVSTTGADSGGCLSAAAPCATIAYAVGQAVDGVDEVRLAAGAYPEAVDTSKRLTFVGAGNGPGAGATTVQPTTAGAHAFSLARGGALRSLRAIGAGGGSETGGYGIVSAPTADGVHPLDLRDVDASGGISGALGPTSPGGLGVFSDSATRRVGLSVVRGSFTGGSGGSVLAGVGVEIAGPGSATLAGVTVSSGIQPFAIGLLMTDGASATIDGSALDGAGSGAAGAVIEDSTATLRHSRVTAERQGLVVASTAAGTAKATISNGLVSVATGSSPSPSDEVVAGLVTSGSGGNATIDATGTTLAVRGPSADAAVMAQRVSGGTPVMTLRNSIARVVSSSEPNAVDALADGGAVLAGSSGFTTTRTLNSGFVSSPAADGNVGGDPRFAGPATGDLRLLASSPLIDRGSSSFTTPGETDLQGRARSLDGNGDCVARPDPGAYELPSTCKPPAAAPAVAPKLSKVSLSRTRFTSRRPRTPGRKRGTTLRFTLSEAAQVSLLFERRRAGRRVVAGGKRRCVKPRRSNRGARRCVRHVRVGRRLVSARKGANRVKLSGRVGGRPLKPGSYRLTLVATDSGGSSSKRVARRFRVLAP